jgi:N-acyl-D-amino-acid deacylase
MHDILIKGGTIIDGSGDKRYEADIAINDGKITEIGELSGDGAREIIDADGLCVTPGFIDISNRSDTRWRLFKDPHLESLLHQGITTIIGGNSGSSLAPIYSEDMLQSMRKWVDVDSVNVNWQNVEGLLKVLEDYKLSVNFGMFVGYGTLRRGLIGDENRELTNTEQISIEKHIVESLEQGALGVSTGLIYSHERNIKSIELIKLAKLVAKNKSIYIAHLRNEDNELLKSIDEVLEIQKDTKAKIHISHLKASGKKNWSQMDEALEKIEKTDIIFDIYPYTFSTTVLYTLLPDWVSDGGKRMMLERLRNKKLRQRVVDEMDQGIDLSFGVVAHTMRSDYFCGKSFMEIAHTQNSTVNDAVIDVLLASDGQVDIFLESVSVENIMKGLRSTNSVISSNGTGYSIQTRNECMEHPRSFGAFPRIISQYVVNKKVLKLEDVIYKISGKVAQELNIKNRGLLKEGLMADIVIFDLNKFQDNSTLEQPYKYATGLYSLIVNGQITIKYGKYTGLRAGQIIRK